MLKLKSFSQPGERVSLTPLSPQTNLIYQCFWMLSQLHGRLLGPTSGTPRLQKATRVTNSVDILKDIN